MGLKLVLAAVVAAGMLAGAASAQVDGAWKLGLPTDPPGKTCGAGKTGVEVNTRLMRNRADRMILIAARGDWDNDQPFTAKLSIDGEAAMDVAAMSVGPLVLVLVEDAAVEARLRAARTLDWTMPWGSAGGSAAGSAFHAEVEGLGAAYEQIDICRG